MDAIYYPLISLSIGFLLDQFIGDPKQLPHPIVGFGHLISFAEKRLNKGPFLILKGACLSVFLIELVFIFSTLLIYYPKGYSIKITILLESLIIFYCLSARTLRKEVLLVFEATEHSVEDGRRQVARIVGRDTSELNPQQIRTAALETLAENLSDGVIAPLFWFALLGVPGMLAYKMVNTLDSMIGYKNERYLLFGRFAARLDDVANYIPARLTALIMLIVSGKLNKISFVLRYGKCHTSPNSGYPESALAVLLNARFGGPNVYFGKIVDKAFIGENEKVLDTNDMKIACSVNHRSEWMMVACAIISTILFNQIAI